MLQIITIFVLELMTKIIYLKIYKIMIMKKAEKIAMNIANDKELTKKINSISCFDVNDFIMNAERYIKACSENRIFCVIKSVSSSGMSRVLKFSECNKGKTRYNFYNFYCLFKALGHTEVNDGFRVYGCGMDMVFHTNYCIIHKLYSLGFMDKKKCGKLSQNTPTVF